MSRRRDAMPRPKGHHWDQKHPVVYPGGVKGCRWCKRPVRPPKRSWCGDPECVRQWTMRTQPAVFRQVVFDRDQGVCAACGFDTKTVEISFLTAHLRLSEGQVRAPVRWRHGTLQAAGTKTRDEWLDAIRAAYAWKLAQKLDPAKSPWEADHIVPVIEGGDYFDLANIRTLCVPCHKGVTSALNRRRAAARRAAKPRT